MEKTMRKLIIVALFLLSGCDEVSAIYTCGSPDGEGGMMGFCDTEAGECGLMSFKDGKPDPMFQKLVMRPIRFMDHCSKVFSK